jgi:hypothetical protein
MRKCMRKCKKIKENVSEKMQENKENVSVSYSELGKIEIERRLGGEVVSESDFK